MAITARGIRSPNLADIPDVPADMARMAADLENRLMWAQGSLASIPTPPSPNVQGWYYWATDDLSAGPNGSPYYYDGTAWRRLQGYYPSATQALALAGSFGTPSGTNKYVTSTDPRFGLSALSASQVKTVGENNQVAAGRFLVNADFTDMGLQVPAVLVNGNLLSDASGNGRPVSNKGTVSVGVPGINGSLAGGAFLYQGLTSQTIYIDDSGGADNLRIRTGSVACWFRTAKRGVQQILVSKSGAAAPNFGYFLTINTSNVISAQFSYDGTNQSILVGVTDVADDRWHFAMMTIDGAKLCLYVDGVLEGSMNTPSGLIFISTGPFNIGAMSGNGVTASLSPMFGRIAEVFVTPDVLGENQYRNLMCARIPHTLGTTPNRVFLNVRRRKRGGTLATTDFPSTPQRVYNLADTLNIGSDANGAAGTTATLANNVGTGVIQVVSGADGLAAKGAFLSGAHNGLSATDAGLPTTTGSRNFGIWFKCSTLATQGLIGWGTISTGDARMGILNTGLLFVNSAADSITGPFVADGQWHHAVVTEENTPIDGVKRKLYVDGRLVGGSLVLNSITLAGANRFRIAAAPDGTLPFTGDVDGAFVLGGTGALLPEQIRSVYNVGSLALAISPKDESDHVEAIGATSLLALFDTLEGTDQIDLQVAA